MLSQFTIHFVMDGVIKTMTVAFLGKGYRKTREHQNLNSTITVLFFYLRIRSLTKVHTTHLSVFFERRSEHVQPDRNQSRVLGFVVHKIRHADLDHRPSTSRFRRFAEKPGLNHACILHDLLRRRRPRGVFDNTAVDHREHTYYFAVLMEN